MIDAGRAAALEAVAAEVRSCSRCRLHETRTKAVPGEGDPDTEVVFVGEGPGFNEDREGRPFVGRAGELLERHLAAIGWTRQSVFITNVVKCRPPANRDPEPDEVAACAPYLRRQLEILDPALVVTLGRHSMGRFIPEARISRDHGTLRSVDPATGAGRALVFPMFHPAAALRSPDVARQSEADILAVPPALLEARGRRERSSAGQPVIEARPAGGPPSGTPAPLDANASEPPTLVPLVAEPEPAAVAAELVPEPGPAPEPGPTAMPAAEPTTELVPESGPAPTPERIALLDAEAAEPIDQLTLF